LSSLSSTSLFQFSPLFLEAQELVLSSLWNYYYLSHTTRSVIIVFVWSIDTSVEEMGRFYCKGELWY
jgi:hypothetical protein